MNGEERQAIEQDCARLVAQYANLNDAGEFDALVDLYVENGRMARPSAPDEWIVGRKAILAAFKARPTRKTRHLCTNVVIEATSRTTATGESAVALFLSDSEVRVGTFRDKFARNDSGWKFVERAGSMTF